MSMQYLAHSADETHPAQSYQGHVLGVTEKAERYARAAEKYCTISDCQLSNAAIYAADRHDLGKLDPENQNELHKGGSRHLPINHVDAGVACLEQDEGISSCSMYAVYSHHKGLPDYADEECRDEAAFRDERQAVRNKTEQELRELLRIHNEIIPNTPSHLPEEYSGDLSVFLRMLLSCLADADHSDTAIACGQYPRQEMEYPLKPQERLEALEHYVSLLQGTDSRALLRQQMYQECRDVQITERIVSCSSPVGTGKTTAIMAHLLHQAKETGARRIFVVLPYTNIISQSVKVYREALILQGEDPEAVIAELHHKADFESEDTRYLTSLWRAPIIVTTAVSFFETLASNRPSSLRRLHELPGSLIFVDEAHAALPVKLLPIAWRWIKIFAEEWQCHWVLASGSLVRFWDIPGIGDGQTKVPELVRDELRQSLSKYEHNRITFQYISTPLSRGGLIEAVLSQPGPRLVIMNTVYSTAVIANELAEKVGRSCVEHISTSLTPVDREKTIDRIKQRLADPEDTDWTLVATSCVEAGVDFSFKVGFRELSSLLSLLQAAGRVNRNGSDSDAKIFSFRMQDDPFIKKNPAVEAAGNVLETYYNEGVPIEPELSTRSIRDELLQYGKASKDLLKAENSLSFKTVNDNFVVIDANTVLAVVDQKLAEQIRHGKSNWRELQRHSVSVRQYRRGAWHLEPLSVKDGLYRWTLPYDSFLGYMYGVLSQDNAKGGFLCV